MIRTPSPSQGEGVPCVDTRGSWLILSSIDHLDFFVFIIEPRVKFQVLIHIQTIV